MSTQITPEQVAALASQNRGPEILAVSWVFTSLAIIVVSLKLFTRTYILHGLGWDDFFIFLSLALIIICTSIFTYDVHLGMGRHLVNVAPDNVQLTVKVNLIANPFGIMAYSFPNISVAILLNRLLPPRRWRSWFLYSLAILQCTIAAVSCVLIFVQCTPTKSLWDPTVPHHCFKPGVVTGYSYFTGSFAALTDIVLGAVPIIAFSKLKLPIKTKVGLCLMMGCTWFAAICGIIKTTKLNELAELEDFTYDSVDLIIWAIVEANVIIIAACIPTLRPFFHKAFKRGPVTVGEGRSFFHSIRSLWGSNRSLLFLSRRSVSRVDPASRDSEAVGESMELKESNQSSNKGILRSTEITTTWDERQPQSQSEV